MSRRTREPGALLPGQVTNNPAVGPGEGPRRLMAAVLEDALRCTRQEERNASSREASHWVFSNDRSHVFSFLSVCDALRVDYNRLRILLRRESRAA